jgi:hypothetical protein
LVLAAADPCRPPEELRQKLGRSRNFPQLSAPTYRLDVVTTHLTNPTPSIGHSISLMLRTSLRSVRGLSSRSVAAASGRQWQAAAAAQPAGLAARVSLAIWARDMLPMWISLPDWLIMHRDTLPTRRPQPHKSLNPQPQRQTRRLQAKHPLRRSKTTSTPKAYPPRTYL